MSRMSSAQVAGMPQRTPESDMLENVAKLLTEGNPAKALEMIGKGRLASPAIANARAVCQLRLGDAKAAIDTLRPQVLSTGVFVRSDVPRVMAVNFATALLMDGNLGGCLRVLDDLRDDADPKVQQLRASIKSWRDGLSYWQRMRLAMGSEPDQPIALNFTPGHL